MPNNCVIFGCTNREGKNGVKMYRIPQVRTNKGSEIQELTERRQRLWLAAIQRKGINKETALKSSHRVCSDHFVKGRPALHNLDSDPDWVPSLNLGWTMDDISNQRQYRRLKKKLKKKMRGTGLNLNDAVLTEAKFEPEEEIGIERQSESTPIHDNVYPLDPWNKSTVGNSRSNTTPIGQAVEGGACHYASCHPKIKTEVDFHSGYGESCQSDQNGMDEGMHNEIGPVPVALAKSNPCSSSDMGNVEKESKGRKDASSSIVVTDHEGNPAHSPEAFVDEKSLHCPYLACEKTKRKLLQELNQALSVEKELKARIECLHNIANVNLDLLKRCLDVDKSPEVEGEFKKVYELVQTIMNVQIWDIRAQLASHDTSHRPQVKACNLDNYQNYTATNSSKEITRNNRTAITSIPAKNSAMSNLNDYIDNIINENTTLINDIKSDSFSTNLSKDAKSRASKSRKSSQPHKLSSPFVVFTSDFDSANFKVMVPSHVTKLEHRSKGPYVRGGVLCDICGKWCIGGYWHFQNHMRSVHTGERPFECERCGKRFHSSCTLNGHYPHCQTEERPFKCKECGRLFKSKTNLRKHGLVHKMKERIYSCPKCNTRCKRLDSFRNHVRSKHSDKVVPLVLTPSELPQEQ